MSFINKIGDSGVKMFCGLCIISTVTQRSERILEAMFKFMLY